MITNRIQPDAYPFWYLSKTACYDYDLVDTDREVSWHARLWHADKKFVWKWGTALYDCRAIEDWPADVRVAIHRGRHCKTPFPDVPFWWESPLVSQRAREAFERAAPGSCQFLPVALIDEDDPAHPVIDRGPRWILNCLHMLDCIDPTRSRSRPSRDGVVRWDMSDMWIDPARVPEDVGVFRLRQQPYAQPFVRSAVRKALEEDGVTGLGFWMPPMYKNDPPPGSNAPDHAAFHAAREAILDERVRKNEERRAARKAVKERKQC